MSATETEAPASGTVRTSDLLIAGEHVAARDGRYFETTEALTGEPIARVAAASVEDVNLAADAAAAALTEWSGLPPAARRTVLERAAVLLGERTDDIVATMSREMGATLPWCGFNVHVAKGMFVEAAATRRPGDESLRRT